jgi:hypothetical protein
MPNGGGEGIKRLLERNPELQLQFTIGSQLGVFSILAPGNTLACIGSRFEWSIGFHIYLKVAFAYPKWLLPFKPWNPILWEYCPLKTFILFYDWISPGVLNPKILKLRPLKLDDKVLVSARMRFWSCIKKVCHSSFLKKPRQNLYFLTDDLASGHISGNPTYLASRYLSTYLRRLLLLSTVSVSKYEYVDCVRVCARWDRDLTLSSARTTDTVTVHMACGHALTNPTPSYGSNSMTEDGGEQLMWRLIGSSRTSRHMAVCDGGYTIHISLCTCVLAGVCFP